jgi:hypothetical protein
MDIRPFQELIDTPRKKKKQGDHNKSAIGVTRDIQTTAKVVG